MPSVPEQLSLLADQGKQYILEDQVGFIRPLVISFTRWQVFRRHRNHAQPLTIQRISNPLNLTQHDVIERHNLAIVTHLRTHIEDFLQCTLQTS